MYKKVDIKDNRNYRGMDTVRKLYTRILEIKLQLWLDQTMEEAAHIPFGKDKVTNNHTFKLRQFWEGFRPNQEKVQKILKGN